MFLSSDQMTVHAEVWRVLIMQAWLFSIFERLLLFWSEPPDQDCNCSRGEVWPCRWWDYWCNDWCSACIVSLDIVEGSTQQQWQGRRSYSTEVRKEVFHNCGRRGQFEWERQRKVSQGWSLHGYKIVFQEEKLFMWKQATRNHEDVQKRL